MTQEPIHIGMLLAGCGVFDGTLAAEAVLLRLALESAGATVSAFCPDAPAPEYDPLGVPTGKMRSTFAQASRLFADVRTLDGVDGADTDAWVIPGGVGVVRALTSMQDYATAARVGAKYHTTLAVVNKDFARVIRGAFAAQVPIGVSGDAAVLVGMVAQKNGARLRLAVAEEARVLRDVVTELGHTGIVTPALECVVDGDHRVFSLPSPGVALRDCRKAMDALAVQIVRATAAL